MRARSKQQVANHHRAADRLATPTVGLLNLPTSSNFIAGLLYAAMCGGPSRCGVCRRQAVRMMHHSHKPHPWRLHHSHKPHHPHTPTTLRHPARLLPAVSSLATGSRRPRDVGSGKATHHLRRRHAVLLQGVRHCRCHWHERHSRGHGRRKPNDDASGRHARLPRRHHSHRHWRAGFLAGGGNGWRAGREPQHLGDSHHGVRQLRVDGAVDHDWRQAHAVSRHAFARHAHVPD